MPNEYIEELQQAFSEFKQANDRKLDKGASDHSDLAEQVDRMSKAVGDLDKVRLDKDAQDVRMKEMEDKLVQLDTLRANGGTEKTEIKLAEEEHRTQFMNFVRRGQDYENAVRESYDNMLKVKAVVVGNGPDGGFAVPEELDSNVYNLLRDASPMRGVCRVITTGADYKQLVGVHGATTGWVGEESARSETTAPDLAEISAVYGEIYSAPKASQHSLDDMMFDVEGWLAGELADDFALTENTGFTTGNGVVKPRGFMDYPISADVDGTRAFGQIQQFESGAAGAFATTSATVSPADIMVDMIQSTKPGHRAGAIFMCNTLTVGAIRKFKDNDGAYIWSPGIEAGEPSQLLAHSLVENEDMPDIADDAVVLAYGNFRNGYTIVDRAFGTRMLRDPYTNKPYVIFYTTKRVGGMLLDSEAIKTLKLAD